MTVLKTRGTQPLSVDPVAHEVRGWTGAPRRPRLKGTRGLRGLARSEGPAGGRRPDGTRGPIDVEWRGPGPGSQDLPGSLSSLPHRAGSFPVFLSSFLSSVRRSPNRTLRPRKNPSDLQLFSKETVRHRCTAIPPVMALNWCRWESLAARA